MPHQSHKQSSNVLSNRLFHEDTLLRTYTKTAPHDHSNTVPLSDMPRIDPCVEFAQLGQGGTQGGYIVRQLRDGRRVYAPERICCLTEWAYCYTTAKCWRCQYLWNHGRKSPDNRVLPKLANRRVTLPDRVFIWHNPPEMSEQPSPRPKRDTRHVGKLSAVYSAEVTDGIELARSQTSLPCHPAPESQRGAIDTHDEAEVSNSDKLTSCSAESKEVADLYRHGLLYGEQKEVLNDLQLKEIEHEEPCFTMRKQKKNRRGAGRGKPAADSPRVFQVGDYVFIGDDDLVSEPESWAWLDEGLDQPQ